MALDPTADLFLRLGAATVLGGLVGLNRQLKHKPAGLRTHALVALGAAVVTALVMGSARAELDGGATAGHLDALSHTVQGILTGIGFLGAGVILRAESGQSVHGLTTAAAIWLAACVGAACGAGAWAIALCSFALVMVVLIVGGPLERWIVGRVHPQDTPRAPGSPLSRPDTEA